MNAQLAAGYQQQNNIWNTGTSCSTSSCRNNITNIYNGRSGASTSIFAGYGSSGVVNSVPMTSVMTAPFEAQVSGRYCTNVQQQTQTDYTGKVMDMMMSMCMMMFEKKLYGDEEETEIIIEDTSEDEEESEEETEETEIVIEDTGEDEEESENTGARIVMGFLTGGLSKLSR